MAIYFLIHNNTIVNVIALDNLINYEPPHNYTLMERKNDRGWIGWSLINDLVVAPQPYPSWNLDSNGDWQPPISMPLDGKDYEWNETDHRWVEINISN